MDLAQRIAVIIDGDSSGAVQAFGQGGKSAQKFDYETQQATRRVSYALAAVGVAATAMAVKSASKFQEIGSEVKSLGRITGDTAQQSSKLRFAAHETGVEINTLATGVKTLEKHLVNNDDAAKALGISYRNARGEMLPFNVILARTSDVFAGMPDGPQKTALAMQLFGRSGAALIPLLDKGSTGLKDMGDQAQRLGLVLDAGAIGKVDEATKASRDFSAALDAVEVAIGSNTLPAMSKVKEAAAGGLGFIAAHKETATLAAGATIAASALGTLGGAASNINEIMQTGALVLSKWKTRSAVVENTALAASYDKVAASAGAATAAELAAAGAAGGAGIPGGGPTPIPSRGGPGWVRSGAGVLAAGIGLKVGTDVYGDLQAGHYRSAAADPFKPLGTLITGPGKAIGAIPGIEHVPFLGRFHVDSGGDAVQKATPAEHAAAKATRQHAAALVDDTNAAAANGRTLRSLNQTLHDHTSAVLASNGSMDAFRSSLHALDDAVKNNGKSLDRHTVAGLANRDALRSSASAILQHVDDMKAQGHTADDVNFRLRKMAANLRENALETYGNRDAVDELLKKWGLLPDELRRKTRDFEFAGRHAGQAYGNGLFLGAQAGIDKLATDAVRALNRSAGGADAGTPSRHWGQSQGRNPAEHRARDDRRDSLLRSINKKLDRLPRSGSGISVGYS